MWGHAFVVGIAACFLPPDLRTSCTRMQMPDSHTHETGEITRQESVSLVSCVGWYCLLVLLLGAVSWCCFLVLLLGAVACCCCFLLLYVVPYTPSWHAYAELTLNPLTHTHTYTPSHTHTRHARETRLLCCMSCVRLVIFVRT